MESNRRYVLRSYICKAAEAREIFSQFRTGAVRFKKPVLYCIVLYCHALFKRMLGFNFLWMHGWGNQICGNARIVQLYVYFVDLRVQLGPVFALLCDRGLAQAVSLSYAEFSHLVA